MRNCSMPTKPASLWRQPHARPGARDGGNHQTPGHPGHRRPAAGWLLGLASAAQHRRCAAPGAARSLPNGVNIVAQQSFAGFHITR